MCGLCLKSFLKSRRVEIYMLLSRIFISLCSFSLFLQLGGMEDVTWVLLWIWTLSERTPSHPASWFSDLYSFDLISIKKLKIEISKVKSFSVNFFMRISDCCQCNSTVSLSVNSSLSDDSSKITLRNTGQNILNRKLVVFTKGNKESCVTQNFLSEFSNPPSYLAIPFHDSSTQISRFPFLHHRLFHLWNTYVSVYFSR